MREFGDRYEENFCFEYDGRPIFNYVEDEARGKSNVKDFFVFVMGPYTAFDARKVYDDAESLESPFANDPLIDSKRKFEKGQKTMEDLLGEICDRICERFGVRAYIATDIESVQTKKEAESGEPYLPVLDQSIEFAAVSDAVVFIFTPGGLTTGTGSEVGAIPADFNLRKRGGDIELKPRERFRIFQAEGFSSATINEIPSTYGINVMDFENRGQLFDRMEDFLAAIERSDKPIFF